jgi:hypothetical protein
MFLDLRRAFLERARIHLGTGKKELDNSSAITYLLSSQNKDGGWGYAPLQRSIVEPTSASLLALRETPSAGNACRRAIDWLRRTQNPGGGWGFGSGDSESAWPSAWAILGLTMCGEPGDFLERSAKWLLRVKPVQLADDAMQGTKRILRIDASLQGWPWLPGEAAFIEPTALAMLALGSRPVFAASARINEALKYIQDRRCQGGGWNIGNPFMFSSPLPARAHTTALVVLALANLAPATIMPEDIKALRSEMQRDLGILALAWGLLALKTLKIKDTSAESRLAALQDKGGGWGNNPYKTAIAIMAFRGQI